MGWHITSGPRVGSWVAERIAGSHCEEHSVAIGLLKNEQIIAGVLYEQWNGASIVAHIAVDGPITPSFLAAIFDYPFNHCGVRKVICPIYPDNLRSIKLARNMGFIEEARIRDASPTGDLLLFTLPKEHCRFLGAPYIGKIRTNAARCA